MLLTKHKNCGHVTLFYTRSLLASAFQQGHLKLSSLDVVGPHTNVFYANLILKRSLTTKDTS